MVSLIWQSHGKHEAPRMRTEAHAVPSADRKTERDIIAGNLLVLRTVGATGPSGINVSPWEPRGR